MVHRRVLAVVVLGLIAGVSTFAWAGDEPKQTKVEILAPAAGQTLTGMAEVRVKITPAQPGRFPAMVLAGLDGPPWVEMSRVKQTDQWQCRMDSTMVPRGRHEVWIRTTDKKARAVVEINVNNPLKCYFADLHSHTAYSDGALIPSVAHEYARDVAKLDVFSLTDHLEGIDDLEWSDTREVAEKANEEGKFVVIAGLEWTKKWGHLNIFDPKVRRWPEDPTEFYQAAADAGVVAKFNHPGDGTQSHSGLAYSEIGDRTVQMMEVRRVEEEKAYIRALNLGWHIAPDGSDDTHGPNWGNNRFWTGILATGLSKRNVWHALVNRHCFSTLDRNCVLLLHVNGAVMGSIVEEPVEKVEIVAVVDEADDDDVTAKIELFEDGKVVQTDEPNADSRRWETTCSPEPGDHYYFVKVTQVDGNLIWSAPVWVTVAEK